MKVVFVAGPYRAETPWEVEENVRDAERWALEIWRHGAAALCPHTNTRYFDKALPDEVFLDGIMEMLRRCDGLFLTDRWHVSDGARREKREAERLGLPVFLSCHLDALGRWAHGERVANMIVPAQSVGRKT